MRGALQYGQNALDFAGLRDVFAYSPSLSGGGAAGSLVGNHGRKPVAA